jgi:6-pyruvoyl-tetrahydropterin synthase
MPYLTDLLIQVEELVQLLKHKLRPENAYCKAHDFEVFLSAPKEELHQFFVGLYNHLPATMHEIEKVLRGPDAIKAFNKNKEPMYIVSKKMLRTVWKRLRDRLASVDSGTSTVEITNDYAAHFFDMYVNNHDGKHMTGNRMEILLLNLPFLLRDLIEPEVGYFHHTRYRTRHYTRYQAHTLPDIIPDVGYHQGYILYPTSYPISYPMSVPIFVIAQCDIPF